jgi:hypothetical protein
MAHSITPSLLHSPFVNALPRLRLLFGNHGVSHPTRERRSPAHSSRAEVQTALAVLASAVESLDAVEHD